MGEDSQGNPRCFRANMKNLSKYIIVFISSVIAALMSVYFLKLAPIIALAIIIFIVFALAVFKDPVFGVFLVAFLLPFERIGSYDFAGITVRASQIFALMALVAWVLIFLAKKENFNAKNPILIPLCFFVGISALSIINALNTQRAVLVFLFNAFVIAVALMIPNLVKNKEHLDKIVKIILVSCFVVSLFGLYQFLGDVAGLPTNLTGLREHYTSIVFGFPRIQSTCLEPLYFANYLLIPVSLCLALISRKKEEKDKFYIKPLYLVLILVLASVNLILTLSRGGYLGFVTVILLSLVIFFRSFFTWKKVLIFILIALVVFISVYYFLKLAGKEKAIETFLTQATNIARGPAVKERTSTYEEAWKLFKDHPWFGIGVGNFGPMYAPHTQIMPEKIGWPIVNNEFLEILAETGIFGFLSFLAFIIVLVVYSIRVIRLAKDSYIRIILIGLLIAFCGILVQYQTFSTLYILHIWFLIGLMVAVQNLTGSESIQKHYEHYINSHRCS